MMYCITIPNTVEDILIGEYQAVAIPDTVQNISIGEYSDVKVPDTVAGNTVFVLVDSNVKVPDTVENIPIGEYSDVKVGGEDTVEGANFLISANRKENYIVKNYPIVLVGYYKGLPTNLNVQNSQALPVELHQSMHFSKSTKLSNAKLKINKIFLILVAWTYPFKVLMPSPCPLPKKFF